MIQVSRLLPQLEKNEAMLRESYDQMIQSWEKVFDPESEEYANYLAERNAEYEQLVGDTLSWMNRVTKLRVGRDGFIVVIDKETNRILAHPNEDYVGRQAMPLSDLSEDDVVSIQSITSRTKAEDLDLSLKFIEPYRFANQRIQSFETLSEYCSMALYGCFIDNGDTYIVCGVPVAELFSYVLTNALVFSVFFLILNMPISYDADLPEVEAVLNEELPKLVIPGMVKPPFYAGVQSFEDSSILLRIFFDVNSDDRFPAMRALNREIRLIFDRRGIEIPFNQIVVHEAEDLSQRDR